MRAYGLFGAISFVFAASFLGSAARAAVPAAGAYPGPVAAWLAKAQQDCPGGYAMHDGAVQSLDLTGTGAPGWVIDPHHLSCAQEPHIFQGDGPASIELFVTLPGGEVV